MTHLKEHNKYTAVPEDQTSDIPDNGFKITTLNIYQELKHAIAKELEEIRKVAWEKNETISKEV